MLCHINIVNDCCGTACKDFYIATQPFQIEIYGKLSLVYSSYLTESETESADYFSLKRKADLFYDQK